VFFQGSRLRGGLGPNQNYGVAPRQGRADLFGEIFAAAHAGMIYPHLGAGSFEFCLQAPHQGLVVPGMADENFRRLDGHLIPISDCRMRIAEFLLLELSNHLKTTIDSSSSPNKYSSNSVARQFRVKSLQKKQNHSRR
jgi:hypothetical protein